MTEFLIDHGVIVAVVCALIAVAYGVLTTTQLLALSPGNAEMQRISGAVQEGARAYLNRQYTVIAGVGVILFVALIFIQNVSVAIGFLHRRHPVRRGRLHRHERLGAGQLPRRRVRPRRHQPRAAGRLPRRRDHRHARRRPRAASASPPTTASSPPLFDKTPKEAVDALIGLGFGGSLISVFARLGGGIFTKAADVGADLVGKVEAGIPEDDPRNPAVIADNVGDNVGDCAGMAADLFETYAVTAVAVMLLGVLTFQESDRGRALPARPRRRRDHRVDHRHVRRAHDHRQRRARALPGPDRLRHHRRDRVLPDHQLDDGRPARTERRRARSSVPSVTDLYLCSLVGIAVTALLFVITDYYTSTRFGPVRKTAEASQTGHATNIISGLAQGLQATALPALVLVLGILCSWKLAGGGTQGIYGIGVAVMGQLSLTGLIVALDAFGPITDNAGGIAEMADMPEEVRNVTDPLDAVGNTTKAVTKGYAIGSAVLAAIVLFAGFKAELAEADVSTIFRVDDPAVLMGLLIGGMMVTLFAALSMEAVGRAGGAVVEEVRRQFREKPGIMEGTDQPDYAACVDIVTKSAQREMIIPSLIPIVLTTIVGLISVQALGGLLIGVIVVGFFFAVMMTAGGGAWDNAKKLIEDGAFGGKGSEAHAASVTGDTVGDPFKDTAGPAINPMIKVANIVAILIIPIIT